jgi:hypothetical protein
MTKHTAGFALALLLGCSVAWAKIPPPPPPTPEAKAAADAKKKASDEKAKAELTAAEDAAIQNYRANLKQAGKPIPKPTPVAAASTPAKGAAPKPQSDTRKVKP